jgi:hypothetical protein
MYMLQHPDPAYKPIYLDTVQDWKRRKTEGIESLTLFQSVDPSGPCPTWMSRWVFQMLRLENRIIVQGASHPVEGGVDDNIQDGVSDAGSVDDNENPRRVPSSSFWDWDALACVHLPQDTNVRI